MSSFFKNAGFTLFGSRADESFKPNKSLYDNFIAMCSLPIHRPNSKNTDELISYIKYSDTKLKKSDYASTILIITDVQLEINKWLRARWNESTRTDAVLKFKAGLDTLPKSTYQKSMKPF